MRLKAELKARISSARNRRSHGKRSTHFLSTDATNRPVGARWAHEPTLETSLWRCPQRISGLIYPQRSPGLEQGNCPELQGAIAIRFAMIVAEQPPRKKQRAYCTFPTGDELPGFNLPANPMVPLHDKSTWSRARSGPKANTHQRRS